jgi:hypothetical protein
MLVSVSIWRTSGELDGRCGEEPEGMGSTARIGGFYVNSRKHQPRRDDPTIAQFE